VGIQKSLSAVQKNDQKIRDFLNRLPPELSLPPEYIPALDESPLDILRRYTVACIAHGYFITLHRPYMSVSESSKDSAVEAAWTLASFQSQLIALSPILEQFAWFIEEFLDPHIVRGIALLGSRLTREPENPLAATIITLVQTCAEQGKVKSLRKRDFAKVYAVCRALLMTYVDMGLIRAGSESGSGSTDPSMESSPDGNGWGMEDVLMESEFKWDEYLVDMVLDSNQQVI
jgi:hypothetical protein